MTEQRSARRRQFSGQLRAATLWKDYFQERFPYSRLYLTGTPSNPTKELRIQTAYFSLRAAVLTYTKRPRRTYTFVRVLELVLHEAAHAIVAGLYLSKPFDQVEQADLMKRNSAFQERATQQLVLRIFQEARMKPLAYCQGLNLENANWSTVDELRAMDFSELWDKERPAVEMFVRHGRDVLDTYRRLRQEARDGTL